MSFNLSYTKEEIAHASRKDVELVTGDRKSKIRARNINRQRALLNVEIKKAGKNMTKHLKEKRRTEKELAKCVEYIFRQEEKRKKLLKKRKKQEEKEKKKLLKKLEKERKKSLKHKENEDKKKRKRRVEILKMIQKMKSIGKEDLNFTDLISLNSINDRILDLTLCP
jgi:hypothetical protein